MVFVLCHLRVAIFLYRAGVHNLQRVFRFLLAQNPVIIL
jgi:hypothetical protein